MQPNSHHNSKKYISSIQASSRFGVTNDYVSLLCRQGKVAGQRVGRQWLVDPESLEVFLTQMQLRKAERSKELSNQFKEEYAVANRTEWAGTFAPKRVAWYAPLAAARLEPHVGFAAIVALPLFMFGFAFSAQMFESIFTQAAPFTYHNVVPDLAIQHDNPLVGSVAYATHALHVPGAYTDSSWTPPAIGAPQVVSAKDAQDAIAFVPLFAGALADTTAQAWDSSFGAAGNIFVASVYEMGDGASQTIAAEFNTAAVWDAWTGALALALYTPAPVTVQKPTVQTQPVQKIISIPAAPKVNLAAYVTQKDLAAQLSDVTAQMRQLIYNQNAQSTSSLYATLWGAIALSSRIDSLPSTVTINNSPIITQASQQTPSLASVAGTPTYGQMLVGNNAGGYDLVATSSLGIASGGGGAGITAVGPLNQTQNGSTQTLATSSAITVSGLTIGLTITAAGNTQTFTPTFTGSVSGLTTSNFASANVSQWTNDAGYSTFAWPFTAQSYGNSTTSVVAFTSGLISNGSTTISGLTSGLVGNANGLLYAFATSTLFGYTPLNPAVFGTTTQNFWSAYNNFASLFATNASTTNATTTNLHIISLANGALATDQNGRVYAAATSTLATISGTLALTQLATQSANTVLVNNTANPAAPTAIATSSFFGTGIGGQVLAWNNGVPQWIASTTYSAGNGITTSFANGVLSIVNSIGYPFIGNATSTQLAFNGGLTTTGATSTGTFAVTSSTTLASILNVGGQLNANQSAVIASTTLTGKTLLANATTTSFAITNISGQLLKTTAQGSVIAAVAGTDYLTTGTLPFTYPFPAGATSTLVAFNGGLTTTGATSTGTFAVTGSTTLSSLLSVGGSLNANGGGTFSGTFAGAHTYSGAITFSSTIGVTGLSTLSNASSSNLSANIAAFGKTGTTTIASTGAVGVGTSTFYAKLTVWGIDAGGAGSSTLAFNVVNNASTTLFAVFDGGNAQLSGTLTQSSDQRLKTNVLSLDSSSTLASLVQLNPVTFNWIDPNQGTAPQIGFIAQEVQKVFPNLVSTTTPTALTPDGTLGVNYIGFISPIISALQEITKQVMALTDTVKGFADSFTTKVVHTNEICVQKSDGTEFCANGDQLAAMAAAASASSAPTASIDNSAPASAPDTTTTDTTTTAATSSDAGVTSQ